MTKKYTIIYGLTSGFEVNIRYGLTLNEALFERSILKEIYTYFEMMEEYSKKENVK